MAGEGRKEEREKEKEAGLGAFVNRGAKETPESVLSPGRPSGSARSQVHSPGAVGEGAQPPKGELSTGYPYTSIHRSPPVTFSVCLIRTHSSYLTRISHSSHGTWEVQEFFHSLPRDCIFQQRPHPPLQGTRTPAGSALVCLFPSSPGAHS